MNDFTLRYDTYLSEFEAYAKSYAETLKTRPKILGESMLYTLMNGGKRIRPVLMLACADVVGVSHEEVLPFALALEMLHTYSLIHDDLPAMDNDDFRRGQPSSHKQFGEDNAVLAGDALQNEAYAICIQQCLKGENCVRAAAFLNECAGIYGMIAGQSADIYFSKEKNEYSEEDLSYVYEHKTGKLLLASVVLPSILAGNKSFFALEKFGKLLGLLFQATDDILDATGSFQEVGKTLGKDSKENKLTCLRLYGLEGAKIRVDLCAEDCCAVLEGIEGDVSFLNAIVEFVRNRTY